MEYQGINTAIAEREFEIRYPWRQSDENIGGGKSTIAADGEQRLLEAIEDDKRIVYLRRLKTACEACIHQMDDSMLEVYKMRYQSLAKYDWKELPSIMHYSKPYIYRRRYAMLEMLAKELGMLS